MSKYKKELETKLNKIGWKLRDAGCDHFQVMNSSGEGTGIELLGNNLSLNHSGVGKALGPYMGALVLNLDRCDIILEKSEPDQKEWFVSIISKKDNKKKPSIFLSFYQ